MFAFELGAAPRLEPSAAELLAAQATLIGATIAAPLLRVLFDLGPRPCPRLLWWSWALRALVLGLGCLVLELSSLPSLYSDPWVDFAVLFVAFAACTVLFSRSLWAHSEQQLQQLRGRLVILIVAAVVLFGLESSGFDPLGVPLSDGAARIDPSLAPVPQGVPALIVVSVALILSIGLARASRDRRPLVDPLPDRTVAFFVPAMPLLLLVLGGETAVLPHVTDPGWRQAAIPLVVVLVLAGFTGARARRASTDACSATACTSGAIETFGSRRWLMGLMAVLFLFAYPAIVWAFLEIDTFGTVLTGFDAFLLTAAFNLASLAAAWLVVAGGLDRIGMWSASAAWKNKRSGAEGMARGLPLLLVFTAFFVMQAELWEVVVETSGTEYWLLVALLVAFTAGFILVSSARQLVKLCAFENWKDVLESAIPAKRHAWAEAPPGRLFSRGLKRLVARTDPPELPDSVLKRLKKLNALGLIMVYQALVFAPVHPDPAADRTAWQRWSERVGRPARPAA